MNNRRVLTDFLKQKNKKELIECCIGGIVMFLMPLFMFLHWLIIGY